MGRPLGPQQPHARSVEEPQGAPRLGCLQGTLSPSRRQFRCMHPAKAALVA